MKPFCLNYHEDSSFLIRRLPPLPHFLADPTDVETVKLKKQYSRDQKKMAKLFAHKGFLIPTLQKLSEE